MSSKSNAPRGPGCQWLYLRVTVGLLNALFVLGVALVALLVTATASLKALNDNGEAHVAALGNAAAFRVSTFFDQPKQYSTALAQHSVAEDFSLPARHASANVSEADRAKMQVPLGGFELARITSTVTQAIFDFKLNLFAAGVWLADGTRVMAFPLPNLKDTVYLEKWWRDNVTDVLSHRETIMYDTKTGDEMNATDPRYIEFMPTRETVKLTDASSPATFNTLAGLVNLGRKQPVKWSTPRFFYEKGPNRYILSSMAMYNKSDLLGFAISGVTLGYVGTELDAVRTSDQSIAVAVLADGFVLGSSGGVETFNYTAYAGGPVPDGCTTTDATNSTVPSDFRLISCMHHVSNFGVPAVRAIAATGRLAHGHLRSEQLKVSSGGDTYFARVEPLVGIGSASIGLAAYVVVIVPEKEILGNVQQTIVVASLITAACVVVAAAACFGLVWWLLWPLRGIAVRMGKAARLEEDPDPVAISPLAEIGDLQRAFVEMRDELDRIRSYVPQSLLRAADSTEGDEDEQLSDILTPVSNQGDKRQSSPKHRRSTGHRKSRHSDPMDASGDRLDSTTGGLRVDSTFASKHSSQQTPSDAIGKHGVKIVDGMKRETVSVLCVNVCCFHRFFADGGSDKQQSVAALVDVVLAATKPEKGVVESFHGDRFLVSFNAVKPAANHGIRATVAAMRVAEAAESLGLAVTAGVATGTAQVGNMGTKGMMRFTIVGPVVAQASALERMCKLYSPTDDASRSPSRLRYARCLVPQRLLSDLTTAAVTRTVDYVHLPQAKSPCLIAEVLRLLDGDSVEDEWMYQLSSGEDQGAAGNALGRSNAVWDACVRNELHRALELRTLLDSAAEKNPNDVVVKRLAECPRLKANCELLMPRDLGDFYGTFAATNSA